MGAPFTVEDLRSHLSCFYYTLLFAPPTTRLCESDAKLLPGLLGQPIEGDPAQLLPQLLDEMIALGEKARYVSQALGGNGHRAGQAAELIEDLVKGNKGVKSTKAPGGEPEVLA